MHMRQMRHVYLNRGCDSEINWSAINIIMNGIDDNVINLHIYKIPSVCSATMVNNNNNSNKDVLYIYLCLCMSLSFHLICPFIAACSYFINIIM